MRIAVTAEEDSGLESRVAQHFGHAPYFIFVDVQDREITGTNGEENPFSAGHTPGQIPGFIKEQGADVILSGGMGGRAVEFFENLGVHAATGAVGTVREAVESYLGGELNGAAPCNESIEHGHGG
ncbi:MAG TPA: NifB/NifX family molybdenum-iron cluster-binding protein [Spirochaetia bacterium]|nr:NifB/NifX family molybdenum-iron cluster-binding protein [Spirochaetia bacterium]